MYGVFQSDLMGLEVIHLSKSALFSNYQYSGFDSLLQQIKSEMSTGKNTVETVIFTGRTTAGPYVGNGDICQFANRVRANFTAILQ